MLTFAGDRLEPLLAGKLSVVFRKMGPADFTPDTVYAYVSARASAIVAKFTVKSWERLPLDKALRLAAKGNVTEEYLRTYTTGYSDLIVIVAGPLQVAEHPVTLKHLSTEYEFRPSSTFMPLSATGVTTIDRLARFK